VGGGGFWTVLCRNFLHSRDIWGGFLSENFTLNGKNLTCRDRRKKVIAYNSISYAQQPNFGTKNATVEAGYFFLYWKVRS
jgi:hypothetical protein